MMVAALQTSGAVFSLKAKKVRRIYICLKTKTTNVISKCELIQKKLNAYLLALGWGGDGRCNFVPWLEELALGCFVAVILPQIGSVCPWVPG